MPPRWHEVIESPETKSSKKLGLKRVVLSCESKTRPQQWRPINAGYVLAILFREELLARVKPVNEDQGADPIP